MNFWIKEKFRMTNYRVGVIGHTDRGNYGHGTDTVWLEIPQAEIVAVADAHEAGRAKALQRLKAPKGYADYRQMLDEAKPDVVSICPRHLDRHFEMVMACVERGIHIYMEKPMCRNLTEADAMVAACEKHKVKLALGFQTRYAPRMYTVKQMIEEGAIGELVELRARGKEDARGGAEDMWVLGSHLFNMIDFFTADPRWCFARVWQAGHPVTAADVYEGNEGIGPLAGDNIQATFGLDDGVIATFGSRKNGVPRGGENRFSLRIYGTQGAFDMTTGYMAPVYYLPSSNWTSARSKEDWIEVSSAGPGLPEPLEPADNDVGNVVACRDLLQAIEEDRQPEASIYEGRTTVEMTAAVFESQRLGGPVNLPLENRKNPLTML
jgi:predicted dehydrogenase